MKINVLGTDYEMIELMKQDMPEDCDGYCDTSTKQCFVNELIYEEGKMMKQNLPEYKKQVKRHELIHAFLHESGLDVCSWADNEEMVDWISIQFPKMMKAFQDAECI